MQTSLISLLKKEPMLTIKIISKKLHYTQLAERVHIYFIYPVTPSGHTNVVKSLLQHGADPDLENAGGVSAFHLAASAGSREIVEVHKHENV